MKCYSRFRATPNEAFSRRAPEQNVLIFPARHAQCDIWVFPHNLTSPLPFPSSMLKVSNVTKVGGGGGSLPPYLEASCVWYIRESELSGVCNF